MSRLDERALTHNCLLLFFPFGVCVATGYTMLMTQADGVARMGVVHQPGPLGFEGPAQSPAVTMVDKLVAMICKISVSL